MSKHYEVKVTGTSVVYVAGAKDEAQAIEFAREKLDAQSMDLTFEAEHLKTKADQESSRRHADCQSIP